ncbi:MAG: hypothetical protein MPJ24_09845 [Pirellulaceae bacterium]|nr:hypothetical protein [Pirellulaceae bacterium]
MKHFALFCLGGIVLASVVGCQNGPLQTIRQNRLMRQQTYYGTSQDSYYGTPQTSYYGTYTGTCENPTCETLTPVTYGNMVYPEGSPVYVQSPVLADEKDEK